MTNRGTPHASRSVRRPEARPATQGAPSDARGTERQEHLDVERLREARVGVERLCLADEIATGRDHDDRDARQRRILELLHPELEAVHDREHQVVEHERRRLLVSQARERLLTVID